MTGRPSAIDSLLVNRKPVYDPLLTYARYSWDTTLVGFSTALANSKAAFNQIIHYDPRTDMVEGSAALVVKVGTRLFPVVELSGEGMPGERPIMNLLGGMKVRVNEHLLLGMAIQTPVTNSEDFSLQVVFQPDTEWGKMKRGMGRSVLPNAMAWARRYYRKHV